MKRLMEVREGEKALLLALRQAGVVVSSFAATTPQAQIVTSEPAVVRRCSVQGRGDTQCERNAGHTERHRYGPPPVNSTVHTVPTREWVRVREIPIKSGSKTFALKVGGPCSLVRPGTTTLHGFKVVSIERHPDGRVNVEVTHPQRNMTRIVPLDRVEYRRPKKGSS